MARYRNSLALLLGCLIAAISFSADAAPPDFNSDRRVNIKCPASVDKDFPGQFQLAGFKTTLHRLYSELDENLKAAAKPSGKGYAFSKDPNKGHFFVCHAKAAFPPKSLASLTPQLPINFQDVFFVTNIDWDEYRVELFRQRDKKHFLISVGDFEKGFIWYNAVLDDQKAYIPVYGFLSLPGEAESFPTIWNSWEKTQSDTATPPESLIDYDFYKILDYRDGYYLLGKDFTELDYRSNMEDFGIIGWVEKKYIVLWRSRLYYHPVTAATFYNDPEGTQPAKETEEINRFYVDHAYLQERLFSDIVEKLDQESLHRFYSHFGFPQLKSPPDFGNQPIAEIFIPGAFTPRLMRMLGATLKQNINTFFLVDVSESMRPFADYIKAFNDSVQEMKGEGFGLRMNRIYAYSDAPGSDLDPTADPRFARVRSAEKLSFVQNSKDHNYAEPLARALEKVLDEIETLQNEREILPLHAKLLFIITDAGPNDLSDEGLAQMLEKVRRLNVQVYFIYPTGSGIRYANPSVSDTPADAYDELERLIAACEESNTRSGEINFRKFQFQSEKLKSQEERQEDFMNQHRKLLTGIKGYLDHVFKTETRGEMSKDVVLYFSDERLLKKMRNWSDRKIQILNHVVKYIQNVDDPAVWEERIAIPAKPVESYLRAIRTQDDLSISDLKKMIIINSLVSVDDVDKARELYNHIKPLIEMKTSRSAEDVFYSALTSREPGPSTRWNRELGEDRGPLNEYIADRGFHLNSFNQAVQRKFMYLKVNELYSTEP